MPNIDDVTRIFFFLLGKKYTEVFCCCWILIIGGGNLKGFYLNFFLVGKNYLVESCMVCKEKKIFFFDISLELSEFYRKPLCGQSIIWEKFV